LLALGNLLRTLPLLLFKSGLLGKPQSTGCGPNRIARASAPKAA